jgi:hypothetical protein
MTEDLFDSAVRRAGDLAGVFEYDGETAYFYLYDIAHEQEHRIVDAIHVLSGEADLTAQDVDVRWDDAESRVALFLRETQWAVFNVITGEKHGGNYHPDAKPQIPANEAFHARRTN